MYAILASMSDAIFKILVTTGKQEIKVTLGRKTSYQDIGTHSQSSGILRNTIIRTAGFLLPASDLRRSDSV
jgi:aspartyl/asparaginyl beta-hydroxylase (cupin superfamily)